MESASSDLQHSPGWSALLEGKHSNYFNQKLKAFTYRLERRSSSGEILIRDQMENSKFYVYLKL